MKNIWMKKVDFNGLMILQNKENYLKILKKKTQRKNLIKNKDGQLLNTLRKKNF
jgi:hypothetical protein